MSDLDARVLVVTNSTTDADLICEMLSDRYPRVAQLTAISRLAADFERIQPQVLILAFKSVAESERQYQNLFRNNATIVPSSYRTIVLCTKDDVSRAYELCSDDYFDDYVMFWPLVYDATRLAMAVRIALRAHGHTQAAGLLAQLASQARRITDLEQELARQLSTGAAIAQEARRTLASTRDHVGAAIREFSDRLVGGEIDEAVVVRDGRRLRAEFDRLNDELLMPSLTSALDAGAPLQEWIGHLPDRLKTPLEAARVMAGKVGGLQPTLLVVDDDEFMRNLLTRVLAAANYSVIAVASGHGALSALRKQPPDLIIMDVNLPDINGIEVTRRLKLTNDYADIPVIMLTGQSEKHVIISSRSVGAIDFVAKPFDRDVLLKKVSRRLAA